MDIDVIALVVVSCINIFLGIAVYSRNIKLKSNIFFFLLCASVTLWSVGLAGFIAVDNYFLSILWAKLFYFAATMIPLTALFFALVFPGQKLNKKITIPASVAAGVFSLFLLTNRYFLTSGIIYHDWGKEVVLGRFEYALFSLYFITTFYGSLGIIFTKYVHARGMYKTQLGHIFLAIFIASIFGVVFNLILPWLGNYQLIWVGPQFSVFFVTAISYAIIKHRLFDIRLIAARSFVYISTLVTIVAIYTAMVFAISKYFLPSQVITVEQLILNSVFAVFVAFSLQPIRKFFNLITNNIFYRYSYDSQNILDKLGDIIVGNVDLNKLSHGVLEVLDQAISAEQLIIALKVNKNESRYIEFKTSNNYKESKLEKIILLLDEMKNFPVIADEIHEQHLQLQRLMREADISIVFRLKSHNETIGYFLVGDKLSGNSYNSQDIRMLNIASDELAVAMQNAIRFDEIQKFNITLQQKVNDATKELRQTNEKLKALDQAKDDFISMASHQLRTPLTSVKGYVSMVLEGDAGKVSGKQRELLEQSFASSQRMVYLIADLLNVSRLRTGKFVIEAKPTYLPDVVEGELSQLYETAKARQLELSFEKPQNFPVLSLDETKIRQVIMNFVDNAIYYTPAGGHIKVELHELDNSVNFTVTDDGIGVPKAEHHHLFNKFYRAGNARKARPDGTGLGLFMAKKVIIAQGGALIFHSQEGKGSTFGFTFPKDKLLVK